MDSLEMRESAFRDAASLRADREWPGKIFLKPASWQRRAAMVGIEAMLRILVGLSGKQPTTNLEDVRRVLVFDPGALGDLVLLAPFLQGLRAHLPAVRIALLGRPGAGNFLLERGMVDKCISLHIPWTKRGSRWGRYNPASLAWPRFLRDVWRLRKERFDLAFATGWCGDLRGNFVIWLVGARRRVGYGYAGGDFLLTDIAPANPARPHVADRNADLLRHIGFPPLKDADALGLTAEEKESARDLLAQQGITKEDLVIGVHPGAGSTLREWGDERFAEVAKRTAEGFGAKILWFGDPAKPKPGPDGLDAVPLALSLRQFSAVLSRCQLFVCNDSGPMHVAAALKIPVVAVFGPQRPEWFGPYGEGHRVVIRNDIWCRPCGDRCRWKEPFCMRLITVEQVMAAVTDVMRTIVRTERTDDAAHGRRSLVEST